jgi:hypothetical protein
MKTSAQSRHQSRAALPARPGGRLIGGFVQGPSGFAIGIPSAKANPALVLAGIGFRVNSVHYSFEHVTIAGTSLPAIACASASSMK